MEHQRYRGRQSFIRAIHSQVKKLHSGKAGQYPVFAPVTEDQLAEIERIRHTHHKGIRLHYFDCEETLIVKIFTGVFQAVAGLGFARMLDVKIAEMGLFYYIGRMDAATYEGMGAKSKQILPGNLGHLTTVQPTGQPWSSNVEFPNAVIAWRSMPTGGSRTPADRSKLFSSSHSPKKRKKSILSSGNWSLFRTHMFLPANLQPPELPQK